MLASRRALATVVTRRLRPAACATETFRTVSSYFPLRSLTSSRPAAVRFYSKTVPLCKDDTNDGDKSKEQEEETDQPITYQTINSSNLTQAEIEKIIAEEEAAMIAEEESKIFDDWVPGTRKRPLKMSYKLEDFEYELHPERHEPLWRLSDKRCGALAIKCGMMPVFDDWGVRHPCTVLLMDNNVVLGHKTADKHGYSAVRVAAGQRKRKNVGKSVLGQYKDLLPDEDKENPPFLIREFRVTDEKHLIPVGSRIHARHFVPGQNVDVAGISKGKGFQGAMKRHNFSGMPASHGVSKSHRALGSTGQCQDPGRVFKGKKMAGRMGGDRVTVQNLRVIQIDRGRNLVFVEGAVPGSNGNFVEIRDAVKKPGWRTDKVANGVDRPPLPTFEYDPAVDGCGDAGHEEFMPLPDNDPLAPELDDDAA